MSSAHVLTWLLRGNPFTASSLGSASLKLCSAAGQEVAVEVSAVASDGFQVSLRGADVAVLVASHLAVLADIKVCDIYPLIQVKAKSPCKVICKLRPVF